MSELNVTVFKHDGNFGLSSRHHGGFGTVGNLRLLRADNTGIPGDLVDEEDITNKEIIEFSIQTIQRFSSSEAFQFQIKRAQSNKENQILRCFVFLQKQPCYYTLST